MKNKILLRVIFIAVFFTIQSAIVRAQAPQIDPADYPGMVGFWTFDSVDVVKATVGADLVLNGTHQAIDGPVAGDHAVNIGPGSYYTCTHGIDANGGGTKVNKYSLMFDFRVPNLGAWYCFYQTNPTVTADDGEIFINPDGVIGRTTNGPGYSNNPISANKWYRMIVSVDLENNLKIYLDGNLILNGAKLAIDADFALAPANAENLVYLLADNNGEDAAIDIAMIGLFNHEIDAATATKLGGYNGTVTPVSDIKPYLQTPGPTGIFVSWHGAHSGQSVVEYGRTADLGERETGTIENIEGMFWHTVQLKDLAPDTEYFYKCIDDSSETEIFNFRTQAEGMALNGHFRYLLIGDTRRNGNMVSRIADAMKLKAQELYGDDIHNQINLVINVGDIVTDGRMIGGYIPEYFTPFSKLSANIPFMVAIGNHENESPYYYKYMKYENLNSTTEQYYSFNLSNIQFLMLNSNSAINTTEQTNWLKSQLEKSDTASSVDMVFAFWHHPEHSEIWPAGNTSRVRNYIDLLQQSPKVQMLAYGHSHNYERGVMESLAGDTNGDFYLLLTGGGGSALDRWGMYSNQTDYPEINIALDYYMFNIVDIDLNAKTVDVFTYSLGNEDNPLDVELVDSFHRRLEQFAPETPEALSPKSEASLQPKLEASGFRGDDELMTSHFQITGTPGDYSNPVFESKRDWVNIYGDTGAPAYTPVDKNEGIDLTTCRVDTKLTDGATYGWRVRYRDKNLKWSQWSEEQVFTASQSSVANDIENSGAFKIYPNPVSLTGVVYLEGKFKENDKVVVAGLSGAVIYRKKLLSDQQNIRLDLRNNITEGVYIIQIIGDECIQWGKIIVKN